MPAFIHLSLQSRTKDFKISQELGVVKQLAMFHVRTESLTYIFTVFNFFFFFYPDHKTKSVVLVTHLPTLQLPLVLPTLRLCRCIYPSKNSFA